MANANNVTAAQPKIGGAVYRAPLGTTLPTDATSALDSAFKALGYADSTGIKNGNSPTSQNIKAFGGDTVLSVQTGKDDTFKVTLIEALNADVLKAVYGDDNVNVSDGGSIAVKANADPSKDCAWVFDLIMRNGAFKRIVVPCGSISALGEISYADNTAVGYAITITATPDASGQTHYDYIEPAA